MLCNGIGVGLEVLDPFVAALDPATTIVRFDVPGTGGSPASFAPYGFGYLARLLGRVLDRLGMRCGGRSRPLTTDTHNKQDLILESLHHALDGSLSGPLHDASGGSPIASMMRSKSAVPKPSATATATGRSPRPPVPSRRHADSATTGTSPRVQSPDCMSDSRARISVL